MISVISLVDLSLENHRILHDWQPLLQSLSCWQSKEECGQHQCVPLKGWSRWEGIGKVLQLGLFIFLIHFQTYLEMMGSVVH